MRKILKLINGIRTPSLCFGINAERQTSQEKKRRIRMARIQRKGRLHLICCYQTNILYQHKPIPANIAEKLGIESKEG